MFQSFSGSSRRPRQVNLSGQHIDPFAASGWGPAASGTKKTIAAAQQERQHRQQERERVQATKRIQRTWRGHKARRELADVRRQEWDELESKFSEQQWSSSSTTIKELSLLVMFFNVRHNGDLLRLQRLGEKLVRLDVTQNKILSARDLRHKLKRLARIILVSLELTSDFNENLLLLLTSILKAQPELIPSVASRYYKYLSHLLTNGSVSDEQKGLLEDPISAPLSTHSRLPNDHAIRVAAYSAFAESFISTPRLSVLLGGLQGLAKIVDITLFSEALVTASSTAIGPESRLWLLAHFISLHRFKEGSHQQPTYMRALSVLLSKSANEIVARIDARQDLEDAPRSHDDDDDEEAFAMPLPQFIKDELVTLVNKESVTGLLAKFNTDYNDDSSISVEGDASLIASYALLLLRIFPRLGEEIRMWLYQGSVPIARTGNQLPALLLFWKAMKMTSTFKVVCHDSLHALEILRRGSKPSGSAITFEEITRERDWRAILLFLELYAFVLRFTDDEEFLSGGSLDVVEPGRPISRSRQSALPLEDVKDLTIFLKNLSFTMFFNATELTESNEEYREGGIGSYFGTGPKKSFTATPERSISESARKSDEARPFLGIAGMTFNYVRGIVTRVLRMVYERDSRRRFLPKDHWLMTSRFDMAGFIPAVVAEEERRHEVTEEEEEEPDVEMEAMQMHAPISGHGSTRSRRFIQADRLRKQQQQAARNKILASIGPRLEILQNMPFAIPFATRVQIFRQFVLRDQTRRRDGNVDPDRWRMSIMHGSDHHVTHEILSRHHAKIRRDQIFEDAFRQFYALKDGLKEPIQITFVDKFDTVEAGIDGGGVTKEFLTSVTNEAFRSEGGTNLFVTNDQNLLYPNPAAMDEKKELLRVSGIEEGSDVWRETLSTLLRQYEFLGRIIGKCLYEGILVDISFAGFFLLKWASTDASGSSSQDSRYLANINDLRDLDESLYQGLLQLKDYPGNVEDFSLDFTINDTVSMPGEPTRTITRELLPNGSNIAVTNENRVLYVSGVARHRLHRQPFHQTRAFLRGVAEIINPSWLSMFNQAELQTLIGGDSSEIDVEDLRRNTAYGGVYVIGDDGLEHPTVQCFWKVMKELDDEDRRKVLKYVTSTPRAPLLGFGQLNPRFSIRDAGDDEQRLPSTSTCINLLKLPRYSTTKTLKEKLVYAINSGAGFDLS